MTRVRGSAGAPTPPEGFVTPEARAVPTRYLQASAPGEVLRHALALRDVAPGE